MNDVTFITGGQRSGKSRYAQQLAEEKSGNPIYLATARLWDNEFEQRIKRHKNDRGEQWTTIEEEKYLSKHNLNNKTVLLDCITLWLTNIFFDSGYNVDQSLLQAKNEWLQFINQDFSLIVVSNEIGMGIIPENEMARKFADLQGWMNQYIASLANNVILMVSGIPIKIK